MGKCNALPSLSACWRQQRFKRTDLAAVTGTNPVAMPDPGQVCYVFIFIHHNVAIIRIIIDMLHRLTQRDCIGSQTILGSLGFGVTFWLFSYFQCKIWHHILDIISLLSDPDFLQGWRNFAPIWLSFRHLTRKGQTTDADRRFSL